MKPLAILIIIFQILSPSLGLDFLFNSFTNLTNSTSLTLVNDANLDASAVRLTDDAVQYSLGRLFHSTKLTMLLPNATSSNTSASPILTSFSTSFVFSDLPKLASSPGFGLAFFISNSTSPPDALASQYFGLFSNATVAAAAPLIAVEFDTGRNPEFNDPDGNHVGVDLNSVESAATAPAGYYNSSGGFVPVPMRSGENVRGWIDFDGVNFQINVTVAPANLPRPSRPTLSFRDARISNYVSSEMYVGFSASKTEWIEAQRILAWSFSDTGVAREINVTNLPVFKAEAASKSLSKGAVSGIAAACVVFVAALASGVLFYWRKMSEDDEDDDEIEDWEMEYWPHRFSNDELSEATEGFSDERLLGAGGFGKVYRGVLASKAEVAVKCVKHDSKQGLREFMAEISSMGRLQHKNLVQMRGWCRRGNQLMLVYDYMPNGSLNRWVFDKPKEVLGWEKRRRVLADVAEGLNYLHHGWDQMVVHRDIKSSNILLHLEMRGRLGDFGLAKLYEHGEVPNTTRVVGTPGYLAPELATIAAPTAASDVYSFGVVLLEVACGRKPIDMDAREDEVVLVDWVRELYSKGRLRDAADQRIKGEYVEDEIEAALKLGLACCHPDPQRRPSMKEIVAILVGETASETEPSAVLSELARGNVTSSSREESVEVVVPFQPQHSV